MSVKFANPARADNKYKRHRHRHTRLREEIGHANCDEPVRGRGKESGNVEEEDKEDCCWIGDI